MSPDPGEELARAGMSTCQLVSANLGRARCLGRSREEEEEGVDREGREFCSSA